MQKRGWTREVLTSCCLQDQLWAGRKREDQETLPLSGGETWRDDRAISDMETSVEKVQS